MSKKSRVFAFLLALLMLLSSVGLAAAASKTMVVRSGSRVNMRSSAEMAKNIIAKVAGGTTVTVLSTTGAWSYIKLSSGLKGYMKSSFLRTPAKKTTPTPAPVSGKYMYVKTVYGTGVNFRSSPNAYVDNRIRVLRDGTKVLVLKSGKYWTKISYGGKTGYVYSIYLSNKK